MTITKNIVTDYSCPTNGTSDVRAAFLAFKADAQGLDAVLTVPAHTYNWKTGADQFPFDGIPNLIVEATGAIFTDDGGAGGLSWGSAVGIPVADPQSSARIQSASAGQTSVTLITAADQSIFPVGRYIAIGDNDMQGGGSNPPNPFNCEFKLITGVSGGVVSFSTELQYDYLSTFPLYDAGNAFAPDLGGPATIWLMPANWNASIEFRGLTADINGGRQDFAKCRAVKFRNCVVTGDGTLIPTVNQSWTLSGAGSNFPGGEFDKMIETVTIEDGASMGQPFIQSSCGPNLMIVDNATITTMNGTPRNMIVRNGGAIGTLKLGTLGYGNTESYEQTGGTIGSITFQPPQYAIADYPSISLGLITRAVATGPFRWASPGANLVFNGTYNSERGTQVLSNIVSGSDALVQTTLSGGWPTVPGTVKVGPHPCPRLRLTGVTGCADAVDYSQAGAYDKPLYQYTKRFYSGLTGNGDQVEVWGKLLTIKVNVTSAAAGTLHVLGQFDNYPTLKTDNTVFSYAPTVDLSVIGLHTITPPEDLWFTGPVTVFCASTTAVFSVEIETDQGVVIDDDETEPEPEPSPEIVQGDELAFHSDHARVKHYAKLKHVDELVRRVAPERIPEPTILPRDFFEDVPKKKRRFTIADGFSDA